MILDCVHFYENRTHSTPNAAELFTIISAWPLPSMHTIKYHLILVSRFLLSALSPQISSSVPTVRPNLVQVTPSLRLSDIRYYLVSITLSTKKPSLGRACLGVKRFKVPTQSRQTRLLNGKPFRLCCDADRILF
jgi:hypothetical protein